MYSTRHAATAIAIGDEDLPPAYSDRSLDTRTLAPSETAPPTVSLAPQDVATAFSRFNQSIFNTAFQPPAYWRRFRFYLPSSVADLKITPSRPEAVVEGMLARQSARLVISVGMSPEDPKKYANEFISYIFQVSEHVGSSTPIFSLRFVKIGTEISQCVLDFGTDCSIAQKFAACLSEVGFVVGFASPTQQAPSATVSVLDVKRVLNGGAGATEADILTLFGLPPNELRVIEGFEEGQYYAALKKADIVFAWLCNPFVSAQIQRDLFQSYGLLIGAVHGDHNFAQKGIPYHLQKKDALASMQGSYSSTTETEGTAYEQYENQNEANDELQDYVKHKDRAVDIFAADDDVASSVPTQSVSAAVLTGLPPLLEDDDDGLFPMGQNEPARQTDEGQMMHWDLPAFTQAPYVSYPSGSAVLSTISLLPAPPHPNKQQPPKAVLSPTTGLAVINEVRACSSKDDLSAALRRRLSDIKALVQDDTDSFRSSFVAELARHSSISPADMLCVLLCDSSLLQLLSSLLDEEKVQLLLATDFLPNVSNTNTTHLLVKVLRLNPAFSNPVLLRLSDPLTLSRNVHANDLGHLLVALQSTLDALSAPQRAFLQSSISSVDLLQALFFNSGLAGRSIARCLLHAAVVPGKQCGEAFANRSEPIADVDVSYLLSLLQTQRVNSATAVFFGTLLSLLELKQCTLVAPSQETVLSSAVLNSIVLPDGKNAFCDAFFSAVPIDSTSPLVQKLSTLRTQSETQKAGGFRLVKRSTAAETVDLPSWAVALREYPTRGAPFPVPTGYTVHLSRSHGYYFFRTPSGDATYKHPVSQQGFIASPQAFCLDEGMSQKDLAKATGVALGEAQQWLDDQRVRSMHLDKFVIEKLGIKYRDTSAAVATRSSLAEKFAVALEDFKSYPHRGHAFPPLPKGWSCNLSISYGLYYFRPPGGEPVYRHPLTQREYRASPQAFAFHMKLPAEKIAAGSGCNHEDVKSWLDDQKIRDGAIDSFVLKELGVRYRSEDDKQGRDGSEGKRRKRSRGDK